MSFLLTISVNGNIKSLFFVFVNPHVTSVASINSSIRISLSSLNAVNIAEVKFSRVLTLDTPKLDRTHHVYKKVSLLVSCPFFHLNL